MDRFNDSMMQWIDDSIFSLHVCISPGKTWPLNAGSAAAKCFRSGVLFCFENPVEMEAKIAGSGSSVKQKVSWTFLGEAESGSG